MAYGKVVASKAAKEIRAQFPGRGNSGLRARLRGALEPWPFHSECVTVRERLEWVGQTVALTAIGRSKLEAVISVAEESNRD